MGGTSWSDDFYTARATTLKDSGKSAFHYSDTMKTSTSRTAWKCHESLDPNGITREARDSDDHPNSNAVAVLFDVTGSMGGIPRELQLKLPNLLSLLIRKGYIDDPQILFGAVGDATCDRVPLQIGQFESGNEMEDDLSNIFIEQGGGGGRRESYELGMYFFANKTKMDCLEKRGDKGYLFTIGDEMPYRIITTDAVKEVFGDTLQADLTIEEVITKLKDQYHYFHILPERGSYYGDNEIKQTWVDLLDQNLLHLDNSDGVCELIAMAIGINEDVIDVDGGVADLEEVGTASDITLSVSRAVATMSGDAGKLSTIVDLPVVDGGVSERL